MQPAATCIPSRSHAFWAQECDTSRTFRPADYSVDFLDPRSWSCDPARVPINLRAALACEARTKSAIPFPDSGGELVEHGATAPPVSSSRTSVPDNFLRSSRRTSPGSFPCNSLSRLRRPLARRRTACGGPVSLPDQPAAHPRACSWREGRQDSSLSTCHHTVSYGPQAARNSRSARDRRYATTRAAGARVNPLQNVIAVVGFNLTDTGDERCMLLHCWSPPGRLELPTSGFVIPPSDPTELWGRC